MSYQTIKKNKSKCSAWIIIDLENIFRRHYIGLKNYYIKNDYIDNDNDNDIDNYRWCDNNKFITELSNS